MGSCGQVAISAEWGQQRAPRYLRCGTPERCKLGELPQILPAVYMSDCEDGFGLISLFSYFLRAADYRQMHTHKMYVLAATLHSNGGMNC